MSYVLLLFFSICFLFSFVERLLLLLLYICFCVVVGCGGGVCECGFWNLPTLLLMWCFVGLLLFPCC